MLKTMSGRASREPLGKIFVRLEADHFTERGERVGDGVDRLDAVPLGEFVAAAGRLFLETGSSPSSTELSGRSP